MTSDFWRVFWAILFWPYFAARTVFCALLDRSELPDHITDHITDNEPIYFGQGTDMTTPFTNSMSAWGSGSTGYYPSTTAAPMTTPPPPNIQNKPKPPLEIPDLDAPRVINLD